MSVKSGGGDRPLTSAATGDHNIPKRKHQLLLPTTSNQSPAHWVSMAADTIYILIGVAPVGLV